MSFPAAYRVRPIYIAGHRGLVGSALVPDLFVNVGTGSEISIRDLATLVAEVEGYEGEIHWDTTKPNGTPRKLMDGSLMQKLGWEPKIGLREGIGATYEWFVEHGSH